MGIEHRNGRVYFYRSQRTGKQVRKEYVASGDAATLIAKREEIKRDEKDFAVWQKKEQICRWQTRCSRLRKALARANQIVADALRASGWHQHKREWRKRHGITMTTDLATVIGTWTPGELDTRAGTLPADVSTKAAKGDRTALPAVRQYLDNPAAVALWGDPGRGALQRWVALYARGDLLVEEALLRRAQTMRERLTGSNPTALDALLAERVVLAWVVLSVLESWQGKMFEAVYGKDQTGVMRPIILELLPKHIDHAHRQLMTACQTLAKVRRAKLPDLLAVVHVKAEL